MNAFIDLAPDACDQCHRTLRASDEVGDPRRHQVTELPPIVAHITEYRCPRRRCRVCGHPTLPVGEIRHELPADDRRCPACGGELMEMAGQVEASERITTVQLTYQVEHHVRQKNRCRCNGAVVTAPGPAQVTPAKGTVWTVRSPTVVGPKNHYGSRSLRGTQVAAYFYTLCETARLAGVDPHAYLLHALYAAITGPAPSRALKTS